MFKRKTLFLVSLTLIHLSSAIAQQSSTSKALMKSTRIYYYHKDYNSDNPIIDTSVKTFPDITLYDTLGRIDKFYLFSKGDGTLYSETDYSYDDVGRLVEKVEIEIDGDTIDYDSWEYDNTGFCITKKHLFCKGIMKTTKCFRDTIVDTMTVWNYTNEKLSEKTFYNDYSKPYMNGYSQRYSADGKHDTNDFCKFNEVRQFGKCIIFQSSNGSKWSKVVYSYKDEKIHSIKMYYYLDGRYKMSHKLVYDKHENIIYSYVDMPVKGTPYIDKYVYEYDEYGNWILCRSYLQIYCGKSLWEIKKREIEYY